MAQYEDASADPAFNGLVGRDLLTTTELLVHGVTLDRNYAKRVDLCSVTASPGLSGPEVIARQSLPAGATLRVVGIRRCTNCLSSPQPVQILITSPSIPYCGVAPVVINRGLLDASVTLVPIAYEGAPEKPVKPSPPHGSVASGGP